MMLTWLLLLVHSHGEALLQELPRENVETLTLEQFRDKYVNRMEPVILQYGQAQSDWRALREWSQEYLLDKCPEAQINARRFVDSFDWAGLEQAPPKISLHELFSTWANAKNSSDSPLYGFDFDIKCDCPELLDDFELLKYFLQNPLIVRPEMLPDYAWPVLMIGPAGTRSGFHADNSFLPFWLTVLQGRKRFRVISYTNWSKQLTNFFVDGGTVRRKVPIFDDHFLANTLEFTGVTVWTGDLVPGDTVYVPFGAGHGALNLESPDAKPAIAVTSNFLDERHERQMAKLFCKAYERNHRLGQAMKEHHCLRLMGVIEGPFNAHRRRRNQAERAQNSTVPFLKNFLSADFCSKNARPGKCSKLRKICDEHGFFLKKSAGPCKYNSPQVNFDKYDIDGDGSLSLTEFQTLAAFSFPEYPTFAELKRAVHGEIPRFRQHDADGDSFLSCSEFYSFYKEVLGLEL